MGLANNQFQVSSANKVTGTKSSQGPLLSIAEDGTVSISNSLSVGQSLVLGARSSLKVQGVP